MLAGVCLFSKLKKSPVSDYQNIEFVDIENAPMITYNEFRPQEVSQDTEQIEAEQQKTDDKTDDEDDDYKTDNSKVENELE